MARWLVAAVLATIAALAVPAVAQGGGWATVGLSSTPVGLEPGQPWDVRLTLLQHGRTPLEGLRPVVIVTSDDGVTRRTFAARPTGEPGIYRARVTFPAAGTWHYAVDDDFAATHTFTPVRIGGRASEAAGRTGGSGEAVSAPASDGGRGGPTNGAAADDGDGVPWLAAAAAALGAGLLVGVATAIVRRRGAGGPPTAATG